MTALRMPPESIDVALWNSRVGSDLGCTGHQLHVARNPKGHSTKMKVEDQPDVSFLSAEQADTNRLIQQLLGTAVAYRYVDFCRLASGTLPLIVSRPLAGHALRELDSLVRHVLATPMEARASDNAEEVKRRREAIAKLKGMGFDEPALQRAEKGLKPEFSHKKQIQQIVTRLGLSSDGDVAKLWIELNKTYGRVHERSFYVSLEVDESFRADFVRDGSVAFYQRVPL